MNFLNELAPSDSLARYLEKGLQEVEGWMAPTSASILAFLGIAQTRANISGDVCEIGIHHGRLFLVLANLVTSSETAVAVDVFADQDKNLDHSGKGDREIFERHLQRYAPEAAVEIIQESSFDLEGLKFTQNRFRIFSIDGGHTAAATENDLQLAQASSLPGTIVLLDDFLSSHWLGVMTGMVNFFKRDNHLIPFALSTNKLYLTTDDDWAEYYRKELRARFSLALEKSNVEFFEWNLDCYGEHPAYDLRWPQGAGAQNPELADDVAAPSDELFRLQREADRLQEQLAAIKSSTSWRITAPARAALSLFRPGHRG